MSFCCFICQKRGDILKTMYSVLMSVYDRENPLYLRESVESMFSQTLPPEQFVLVIDGAVNEELQNEITYLQNRFNLELVHLKENVGLGRALNEGLKFCRNEYVARMDSDDISFKNRIEKQIELMDKSGADIVSAGIAEFEEDTEIITGYKLVPQTYEEILKYVRKRNPFNHPAVLYKKSVIEDIGGYMDYELFEDYELFARALSLGKIGANVEEPLVYMRVGNGMYKRRGGFFYVKKMLVFYKKMSKLGFCSFKEKVFCVFPRALVAILPSFARKIIYKIFLRG